MRSVEPEPVASAVASVARASCAAAERLEPAQLERSSAAELMPRAAAIRDACYARTVTFSPKVFLPLTNLCRNRCDYCSFRKSPGDRGEWTMTHDEVVQALARAQAQGCVEALFCLGDKPESAFSAYRRRLGSWGHASTVDYLVWGAQRALEHDLLPHTNAGVLTRDDMLRLRPLNVSLGLMLENISARLCEKGMPHHRAPDKRPDRRMRMIHEAGELGIAFTTGILIGIGETRRERIDSLIAIRDAHLRHGHIQEVIVQNFTPRPGVVMEHVDEQADEEMAHAVACARLILPPEISVQAPPNLNPTRTQLLVHAGINDFGGISPVTPDYINPRHPWPLVVALGDACGALGFELRPRLPIYPRFTQGSHFLDPSLSGPVRRAATRLSALPAQASLRAAGAA
jgi:7,8-didemethyl-8-hydroxy-5-deazariboflavin synthase CofG subunit